MGKNREFVTNEAFVKAWMKGGTTGDVAERLGRSIVAVYGRAKRLRKIGVALPKLDRAPRGLAEVDVKALNALIKGAK